MRRIAALLVLAALLGGCGFLKRTFGIRSSSAYREPGTTAVWGNWVLRTPDSTAFVGAENVQLALNPGTFTLTAVYPARTMSISGTASLSDRGVLTLVPSTTPTGTTATGRSLNFMQGQPIALLASAAGNTLVFSPEHRETDPTPSSVWHKMDAAKEAGLLKRTASTDSTRSP
jgi:hypothetical protein